MELEGRETIRATRERQARQARHRHCPSVLPVRPEARGGMEAARIRERAEGEGREGWEGRSGDDDDGMVPF